MFLLLIGYGVVEIVEVGHAAVGFSAIREEAYAGTTDVGGRQLAGGADGELSGTVAGTVALEATISLWSMQKGYAHAHPILHRLTINY